MPDPSAGHELMRQLTARNPTLSDALLTGYGFPIVSASFSCLRTSNPLSLVRTDSAILQTTMASSSSTFNMLDEHCFRTMFNQNLYEELVSKKMITPEMTFDLEDDEYPCIKEQIALRGWRRLASPRTKVSKWMIQEFYANAVQFEEERWSKLINTLTRAM
ncbi:hypothetical protein PIB30_044056 [Stylosanthes scabra]|uniref:Uncharacterized protein n=1 Tax=Stylosanthes scabra TaxID=79078 RepID=A0ABU6UF16_9FABA|nr:hypothetical protein [Stylosanthes scabra]